MFFAGNSYFQRRRQYGIPTLLNEIHEITRKAYDFFSGDTENSSDASQWLLDNYYIIQRAITQVARDMSFSYHRLLPLLEESAESDRTRIFHICRKLTPGGENIISITGAASFLRQLQKNTYLTTAELWAIPVMLRLSVLLSLSGELASILGNSGNGEGISAGVINLRKIEETDWKRFFERISPVEKILRQDPGGIYRRMDFGTRDSYRKSLEMFSRKHHLKETKTAETTVALARAAPDGTIQRHIGWYLMSPQGTALLKKQMNLPGRKENRAPHYLPVLIGGSVAILTALMIFLLKGVGVTGGMNPWIAALLLMIPGAAIAIEIVFQTSICLSSTRRLPKLDYSEGIPDESRTIIVIPAILSSPMDAVDLSCQLERHYLSNGESNVLFGLLTDLQDSSTEKTPSDSIIHQTLAQEIEKLNIRYPSSRDPFFYLFHRKRLWNPRENVWMGWERKRGKLQEFNRLLLGLGETSFYECAVPERIKYVITLDCDTLISGKTAAVMAGAMAHPLNRYTGRTGYTVLQPRTLPLYKDGRPTPFFRAFSGDFAVDLYSNAVSDFYQDLFQEGIYMGKGIYDLTTFHDTAGRCVPENSLLSHDLLEGILGRAGYLSDVVVYEDFPRNYIQWLKRQHRWIRGDWQLLPWLFKGGFSLLDRWKIADNMRRSLTEPWILALLVSSWLIFDSHTLLLFTIASTVVLFRSQLMECILSGFRIPPSRWLRGFLETAFLPLYTACSLHGISVTLFRVFVSGKNLLSWTSAAVVSRKTCMARNRTPFVVAAFSWCFTYFLLGFRGSLPIPSIPFLLLWGTIPLVMKIISPPVKKTKEETHVPIKTDILLKTALRTWYFFDVFVGPEDHWLPPDHYQEEPLNRVAHRTSPTNIGLFLLSVAAAGDLGFTGIRQLLLRVEDTLEGMRKLGRYRGHILNWHNTKTLEPLKPRYVSTVDSGNLLASLITLKHAVNDSIYLSPGSRERWKGLAAIITVLADTVEKSGTQGETLLEELLRMKNISEAQQNNTGFVIGLLKELCTRQITSIEGLLIELTSGEDPSLSRDDIGELITWSERLRYHLSDMLDEIETLYPWLLIIASKNSVILEDCADARIRTRWNKLRELLPESPSPALVINSSLKALEQIRLITELVEESFYGDESKTIINWLEELRDMVSDSRRKCIGLQNAIDRIREMIETEIRGMDFSFLYNEKRKVFSIGFNVDTENPDANCYDLLASEARLASFLAIARRNVPLEHWVHLSRPFTSVSGMVGLLSWSGTMFEYLMPLIFTGYRSETLLGRSCAAAVKKQIEYGKNRGIPWGISESGYYWFDQSKQYQYRAFGVPGLGYRRGLEDDLVVAPYASFLALPIHSEEVLNNLAAMDSLGMTGKYGFYEAIDFTWDRLPGGKEYMRVWSYMAHHQGMILLSIQNFLQNEISAERFHRDPEIGTVELLLHESLPGNPNIVFARPKSASRTEHIVSKTHLEEWVAGDSNHSPLVHCVSGGNLGVILTDTGNAYISWKNKDISRIDSKGERVFIRDLDTGEIWNSCEKSSAVWYPHKVEYLNKLRNLTVFSVASTPPEFDGFVRKVTLTNHSHVVKKYFVCSIMEPALGERNSYSRHQEFNRLFLSTDFSREQGVLTISRRKRHPDEEGIAAAMFIPGMKEVTFETERENLIGRGGSENKPRGLMTGKGFSGKTGTTVDPVLAMGVDVLLEPEKSKTISFVIICGEDERDLLNTAEKYSDAESVETAAQQCEVFARRELATWGGDSTLMKRMQPVLSSLVFPSWPLRPEETILRSNTLGQKQLWRFGISGDIPVLLVSADEGENLDIVRDLLRIHRLWRGRGFKTDLVILNMENAGYENELQGRLRRLLSSTGSEKWEGKRGGVFLVNKSLIEKREGILLKTWASVVLNCSDSLEKQTGVFYSESVNQPDLVPVPAEDTRHILKPVQPPENLVFFNGYGGFTEDGREYVIYLGEGKWLPRPWINVIATEKVGLTASESGLGCLWVSNSGENRLIPWRNDPLRDTPGLAVYIRDEETGKFWSPSPLPVRDRNPYLVRHSAGYTVWEHNSRGLAQRMTVFTDVEEPVAAINVSLENNCLRNRRIGVTIYAEPVLGTDRTATSRFLVSGFNTSCNGVFTWNTAAETPPSGVFFLASSRTPGGITTDRTEFLGKGGEMDNPAAMARTGLSGSIKAGGDPCSAIQVMIWIGPGERKEVTFLTGQANSAESAAELIKKQMIKATGGSMIRDAVARWDSILGTVQINTPNTSMNLMVNRWLLYQTLSCRIFGRTALYQSSGAYGFRDQLQDCLALCTAHREIPGKHILECASKQFFEGDVLHWWHPPLNAGVRTRCSDDLLWLPFAVAEYVKKTGDRNILNESVPYLEGDELSDDQMERYQIFTRSDKKGTLHEHCMKAINRGLTRGRNGLPLMGSHDWNDGMSLVGYRGKGESVWLGWFLYKTMVSYSELCTGEERNLLSEKAARLKDALSEVAWDKDWYLRGFFDDGYPLGSRSSEECMIASIAQSWAVISGAGEKEKTDRAMASVMEHLVDRESGLVLLFTPPFDRTSHHPGYIMGYPPGVRENGGQYTHAAVWVAWAMSMSGKGSQAMDIFNMINPVNKSFPEHMADTYRVEPYAVAGDVYSSSECPGRGGWTWYTGASGWMYRLATEAILGLNTQGDFLIIDPCVPETWEEWRVTVILKGCRWSISFSNPESVSRGIIRILVNGSEMNDNRIKLNNANTDNLVHVIMGESTSEL